MIRVSTNRIMSKWPFAEFVKWHKDAIPKDSMTAEQRYVDMGGVIPVKQVDKVKTTSK